MLAETAFDMMMFLECDLKHPDKYEYLTEYIRHLIWEQKKKEDVEIEKWKKITRERNAAQMKRR
jgi:glutathionyl-hydroquinone reductase